LNEEGKKVRKIREDGQEEFLIQFRTSYAIMVNGFIDHSQVVNYK
jgi:hypothetical protein